MPKISITSITDLNVFVKYLPISVDTTTKNSEYKTILAKPHTFMFNMFVENNVKKLTGLREVAQHTRCLWTISGAATSKNSSN